MAHQFDSGMFVNSDLSKEWHGLGRVVEKAPASTIEAMQLAGMDWRVEESPVITIGEGEEDPTLVEGFKVLRRSDTKSILHVCQESWTPVQNVDAFQWFDPLIADGDVEISAAVSLVGGKRIAITAKIKDSIGEVVNGDPVEAFLLLYNSHNGSLALGGKFTNTRVVCANTLAIALRGEKQQFDGEVQWGGSSFKIKHTKSVHANMATMRDLLDVQRRNFRQTMEEYQAMAKVDFSSSAFDLYLSKVFAEQLREGEKTKQPSDLRCYDQLVGNFESGIGTDIKGVGGTAWAAYNAVTEWTTHQRGMEDEGDIEAARKRLNSLWFGSAAGINEKAHSVALAMI